MKAKPFSLCWCHFSLWPEHPSARGCSTKETELNQSSILKPNLRGFFLLKLQYSGSRSAEPRKADVVCSTWQKTTLKYNDRGDWEAYGFLLLDAAVKLRGSNARPIRGARLLQLLVFPVWYSAVFPGFAVVVCCRAVLCGRWVGFYEKWKPADKTKEEVPVSSSHLLKPTDGVGKGGGLTRSGGKAESRKSTSKQRLSRGQKQCQVQREMERGKPELPAPSLTKRPVLGTGGKSEGWLKRTHCSEKTREIWEKEIHCDLKVSRVSCEKLLVKALLWSVFSEFPGSTNLLKVPGNVHVL